MFDHIDNLRILRLSDNTLQCDCNMSWLARWLKVDDVDVIYLPNSHALKL